MAENDWVEVKEKLKNMTPANRKLFDQNVTKRATLYSAILLPATVGLPLSMWYCARQFLPALCGLPPISYSILGAASLFWTKPTMKNMGYIAETLNILRAANPKEPLKVRWDVDITTISLRLSPLDVSKGEVDISEAVTTNNNMKAFEFSFLYVISSAGLIGSWAFLLLGAKRELFPRLYVMPCLALGTAVYAGISYVVGRFVVRRPYVNVRRESGRKLLEPGTDDTDQKRQREVVKTPASPSSSS